MLAAVDKIKNSPDGRVCEQSFLIKMNNPVVVLQDVVVFLQAELQGPSLVQSPGLGLVCGVHHCLNHFLLFLQIDRFVRHNLNTNINNLKTSMM